jgi:IS30 family transposase
MVNYIDVYKSVHGKVAVHARFTVATELDLDFRDPAPPWQRDMSVNTNGLVGRSLPHSDDLVTVTASRPSHAAVEHLLFCLGGLCTRA